MKFFMICLLAVGALAVDTDKKASVNKQAKRGILSIDQRSNIHKGEQPEQQLIRYTQAGHQYVVPNGPDFTRTAQVPYHKAVALPGKNQHETEATVVYNGQLGQISHQQVEQGYDHSFDYQGQQVGHEFQGYGGHPSTVAPIEVESNFLRTPFGLSHQVPFEVRHQVSVGVPHEVPARAQHQVPVSSPYQDFALQASQLSKELSVEVSRSVEIPVQSPQSFYVPAAHEVQQPTPILVRVPSPIPTHVAHHEPLNIATGYETSVGHNQNVAIAIDQSSHAQYSLAGQEHTFYRNPVNFEALDVRPNSGTVVSHEHIDVGSQQYNFKVFKYASPNVHQGVSYNQHVAQPVQAKTTVSENQHSGYSYDKPTKKFTF